MGIKYTRETRYTKHSPYAAKVKHEGKLDYIHRHVARLCIPNPENKPCVNHINGDKTDNRISNLEWVTYSENLKHAWDNGLTKGNKGRKNTEEYCKSQSEMLKQYYKDNPKPKRK